LYLKKYVKDYLSKNFGSIYMITLIAKLVTEEALKLYIIIYNI